MKYFSWKLLFIALWALIIIFKLPIIYDLADTYLKIIPAPWSEYLLYANSQLNPLGFLVMEFLNNITQELENKIAIYRSISLILLLCNLFLVSKILKKNLFNIFFFPAILYCLLTSQNYILNLGLALFLAGYYLIHSDQQKYKSALGIFLCFISAFVAPEVFLVLLTLKVLNNNHQSKYLKFYAFMIMAFVIQVAIQYCADIYVQRVPVLVKHHDIHNSLIELLQNNFNRAIFFSSQIILPIPSLFFKQTLTPTISLIIVFSLIQLAMLYFNRRLFMNINKIIFIYIVLKTILWSQDIYYDPFSIVVTNNYNSSYSGFILTFCLSIVFIYEFSHRKWPIRAYLTIASLFFVVSVQKETKFPDRNQFNTTSPYNWVLLTNREDDSLKNICKNTEALQLTESDNALINWHNKIIFLHCQRPEQLPIILDILRSQSVSIEVPTIFFIGCYFLKSNPKCLKDASRFLELSSIYERSTAYYANLISYAYKLTGPTIAPHLMTIIFQTPEQRDESKISEQMKLLLFILDMNKNSIDNKEKYLILQNQNQTSSKK
jgi:hypothetical protein